MPSIEVQLKQLEELMGSIHELGMFDATMFMMLEIRLRAIREQYLKEKQQFCAVEQR